MEQAPGDQLGPVERDLEVRCDRLDDGGGPLGGPGRLAPRAGRDPIRLGGSGVRRHLPPSLSSTIPLAWVYGFHERSAGHCSQQVPLPPVTQAQRTRPSLSR